MCNSTAVDLAESGGYILAAPMGCNEGGWYGSPVLRIGGRGGAGEREAPDSDGKCHPGSGGFGRGGEARSQPDNLAELSEKDVMNVLAMVRDEFNVDNDRIYLTGHSMGGAGTYFLGSKHADIWAAIAPVAPAAFAMMENRVEYLRPLKDAGVPIIVVHGDMDEAVPVETSRDNWVPSMEELGIEHEYVELPGISHGPVITASQKYIYEFFGKHSK
jgi:dipeptidyl aminopeptidase/acylaminoacyl peptidase